MGIRQERNADRFQRLFPRRTTALIDCMRLVQACANKANYSYNEKKAASVIKKVGHAFIETANKFGIEANIEYGASSDD
tara:strand:- start:4706 stop:4942 length:237 start_codon:yes stop_codon:yes gene_type:complete